MKHCNLSNTISLLAAYQLVTAKRITKDFHILNILFHFDNFTDLSLNWIFRLQEGNIRVLCLIFHLFID